MEHTKCDREFERLVEQLNDQEVLQEFKSKYDKYRCHWLPRLLGAALVAGGTLVYGKLPSYLKFRAVEVIARVPYHSWQAVGFLWLTLFYANEKKALALAATDQFARIAQDNETMHVVVISSLAKQKERAWFIRDTFIPLFFACFYFASSSLLYVLRPKWSFELNYLFEQHAFDQYQLFLEINELQLKQETISSPFLAWYGRTPKNQYDFFLGVRNDEIIHRNHSIDAILERRR